MKVKLILDLDENVIRNMQDYADSRNISINELIETLFNQYLQDPAELIQQIYSRNGHLDPLFDFADMLDSYFNEFLQSLKKENGTAKGWENGAVMEEVIKRISEEHIKKPDVLTDLYLVYNIQKMLAGFKRASNTVCLKSTKEG